MIDLEKELYEIGNKRTAPSEELVQNTKREVRKVMGETNKNGFFSRDKVFNVLIYSTIAVVLLVVGIVSASLMGGFVKNKEVAYYTLDINPSVCFNVNKEDVVVNVVMQNNDSFELMNGLNCIGMEVDDAIKLVIQKAKDSGYITSSEQYVVIGHFVEGVEGEEQLTEEDLQAYLEQNLGDMVQILIVTGDIEDKEDADEKNVSAGLLKVQELSKELEVDGVEEVAEVLEKEDKNGIEEEQYPAPSLKYVKLDNGIKFNWNVLDFEKLGYEGEVTYSLIKASTEGGLKENGHVIENFKFIAGEDQPTSFELIASKDLVGSGVTMYYMLKAEYKNNVAYSNKFKATMPGEVEEEAEPTEKPEEQEEDEINTGYKVTGKVYEDKLKLYWDKATESDFQGYKIVASRTNSNPKYPEDGYVKYITDRDTTSKSLYTSDGLSAGKYYYFSVTYLYEDSSKKYGSSVKMKVPEQNDDSDDDDDDANETYLSTTIRGEQDASTIYLTWNKIEHSQLDGYKVMYSFTDSNPVYGDGSNYYKWITNASTTSTSLNITELSGYQPGAKCYFSITALYKDHSVKKAGNVVSFVAPNDASPTDTPSGDYVSSTIRGEQEGNTISLSWDKVEHSEFDGYKVMYSFTDSNPVYGDGSSYYDWITNASTTNTSLDIRCLSGYEAGAKCYFSITVLYDGHSVKKGGNVISYVAPGVETPKPTPSPTAEPTLLPTAEPTPSPTAEPTAEPTPSPTAEPTPSPTAEPTLSPTAEPG